MLQFRKADFKQGHALEKGEKGGEKRFWVIYSGGSRLNQGMAAMDNLLRFISLFRDFLKHSFSLSVTASVFFIPCMFCE